jgi:quinol monooxygenase YgiN
MITFITHLRVSSNNASAFEALLAEMCAKVREHESDVAYYEFAKSLENPGAYVVIEVYRDEAALKAHAETDHIKKILPKTAALVEGGKFDVKQYVSPGTVLSKEL